MISLAQVRDLELRVGKMVDALRVQSAENASLRQRVSELEAELDELGNEISTQKADEEQIEAGLRGVFDMLDRIDAPNGAGDGGEAQSENETGSGANEINPDTEPEDPDHEIRAGGEDSSIAAGESDATPIPNDEIHHPDKSGNTDSGAAHADDDRPQNEFDIF